MSYMASARRIRVPPNTAIHLTVPTPLVNVAKIRVAYGAGGT